MICTELLEIMSAVRLLLLKKEMFFNKYLTSKSRKCCLYSFRFFKLKCVGTFWEDEDIMCFKTRCFGILRISCVLKQDVLGWLGYHVFYNKMFCSISNTSARETISFSKIFQNFLCCSVTPPPSLHLPPLHPPQLPLLYHIYKKMH